MEWNRQNFWTFWTDFPPFTHPMDAENKNFGKLKKTPEDIIILHMCTINNNHMMYGSYEIWSVRERIFYQFGTIFAILPP